jgi:hypothetical protein
MKWLQNGFRPNKLITVRSDSKIVAATLAGISGSAKILKGKNSRKIKLGAD